MTDIASLTEIARQAIARAMQNGADAADTLAIAGASTEVEVRDGETESVERAEARELGLRVFVGKGQAVVSAGRFGADDIATLAERGVAMAKAAPPDEHAGLPERAAMASDRPSLAIADDADPGPGDLLKFAHEAEAAGLGVEGVAKSSGASASASRRSIVLATSTGFEGAYSRTGYALSATMIAGNGTAMERDYDFSSAVHFAELGSPDTVGRSAGERAARKVNPRKLSSRKAPVVFDRRVAGGLIGHLAGAVSGAAVARGTSFLLDSLGKVVFGPGITVVDDGRAQGRPASRPFDGEGMATRRTLLIDRGRLATWLLDIHSARKLGLQSTGHASRSPGGVPSPSSTNLHLEPGPRSREELLAAVGTGLLVTELLGMGVNGVTGDYSRGAAGYWIEGGEIAYPVSEITIAGNLKDMYRALEPASDLEFRGSTNAPTTLVGEMTIAGV